MESWIHQFDLVKGERQGQQCKDRGEDNDADCLVHFELNHWDGMNFVVWVVRSKVCGLPDEHEMVQKRRS